MESAGVAAAPQTPDSMSEILREITMLKGAFSSVDMKVRELVGRLDPVLRAVDPSPISSDLAKSDGYPTNTEYGRLLRLIQEECSSLERIVEFASLRLEV